MGVRAIVVNKKNSAIQESIFSSETKGCLSFMCAMDAVLLFKANPSPLLWDGFPKRMLLSSHTGDYRAQGPVTLSMKDTFMKTYSSSTFVWKECKFLCI